MVQRKLFLIFLNINKNAVHRGLTTTTKPPETPGSLHASSFPFSFFEIKR